MSSSLVTLPFELLLLTAKYLHQGDLFTLSLTCHTFHNLTGPLLERYFIKSLHGVIRTSIIKGRIHLVERGIVLGNSLHSSPEWAFAKAHFLWAAIVSCEANAVRVLLAHGTGPNNSSSRLSGVYPLTVAAGLGSVEITRMLLDAGAGVNNPSPYLRCGRAVWTALSQARSFGHVEVAELLESYGGVEIVEPYKCSGCCDLDEDDSETESSAEENDSELDELESRPRLADGNDDGDDDGDDGDGDDDDELNL